MSGGKLRVRYSERLARQLAELKEKAEKNPAGRDATAYRTFANLFKERLVDPQIAFDVQYALRDDLKPTRRVRHGRLRVFYIASTKHKAVIGLMIGYRKEGHRKDAYRVFKKVVRSGEFDKLYEELEQDPPKD